MILFGMVQCLQTFLFHVTILPIRFLLALISLVRSLIRYGSLCVRESLRSTSEDAAVLKRMLTAAIFFRRRLHRTERIDLVKVLLIVVGFCGVRWLDITDISAFVRQETLIKLKILFTLLELLDKLLCNYGEHIVGALFWAVDARPETIRRGLAWHLLLSMAYIGTAHRTDGATALHMCEQLQP
jgi:transmembrane anterior posterior transformation protein 1